MKAKKNILIVMMFLLMIPSMINLFQLNDIYAINENRIKRGFPEFSDIKEQGFQAFNEWYNDNFGMRDILIRLQHQIDYSIFHYSKELYFSHENEPQYLFYRNVIANEQIINERMTEERKNEIIDAFMSIKRRLEEKNIDFRFMVPPQKNEVLFEEQKFFPVNRPNDNMYYVMQRKFEESELKENYVNILDVLIEQNKKVPTYYYSDFHWNDWGAACAFGKMINDYAQDKGLGMVYDVDQLEISTFLPNKNFGQLSSLSILEYDIPLEYTADNVDAEVSNEIELEEYPNWMIWENEEAVFSKAVLFIGDSYTPPALCVRNGTSSGIVALFPKVYFCSWNYAQGALDNLPADVGLVVIEAIESNYGWMNSKVGVVYQN